MNKSKSVRLRVGRARGTVQLRHYLPGRVCVRVHNVTGTLCASPSTGRAGAMPSLSAVTSALDVKGLSTKITPIAQMCHGDQQPVRRLFIVVVCCNTGFPTCICT